MAPMYIRTADEIIRELGSDCDPATLGGNNEAQLIELKAILVQWLALCEVELEEGRKRS